MAKYTREEIEAIVKEKGTLAGLDLEGVDLSNMRLMGVDLSGANLTRADLSQSSLYGANFRGATLLKANLERANLNGTDLEDCNLLGANLDGTRLRDIKMNSEFMVVNEKEYYRALKRGDKETAKAKLTEARDVYRLLRAAFEWQSQSRDVGMVFIREMTVSRRMLPRFSPRRLWSKIADISTGYGESIGRIITSMFVIMIVSAILFGIGGVEYGDEALRFGVGNILETGGNLFYFSAVVFTTVGFGDIVPLGALSKVTMMVEGFLSIIYMAILIIALYKRSMAR
ncbi:MAG: pentapeptide repeat-containing protein [Fidelibacterota bacterium]|nr:MAG: pentapeptide repeat-containing protein [Candidatus Neomarinimicrobiota bacterium]